MDASWLDSLNEQQRAAATHDGGPLLIIAGAGTGKTNTLAHRVAYLISKNVDPSRILLLTFTRRASSEMLKRVEAILKKAKLDPTIAKNQASLTSLWGGTFHAIANRLLRVYAESLGLGEAFTVIDRSDAEDLMGDVRAELQLDQSDVRFPKKGTCLSIYSRCVNAQETVEDALKKYFPWCAQFPDQLKALFRGYTEQKQKQNVLDYDDLLLFWYHLMQDEAAARDIAARFDAVLVDEYQDTNALQAAILHKICPAGRGLTVVGDDAQSIYSFRAATVNNILEFPDQFPFTTVTKLEQNYRSAQPILEATNRVIAQCPKRYNKDLFSTRGGKQMPRLVTLVDEDQQSEHVIKRILELHESGVALKQCAVLFRASHHSDALEVELQRRNIPFVKYGGLKFLEAAHVKDVISFLRLADNPRDFTSGARVLQLMDGFGPAYMKRALQFLGEQQFDLEKWADYSPPLAAAEQWPAFVDLITKLAPNDLPLPEQVGLIKQFYTPILERRYDQAEVRSRDIDQLEQIASNFRSRTQMLSDLALDPPASTQDLAGPPLIEEDYVILSTIHSAKGCEWDAVFVLHAADGNIPSDMATGSADEIEEERRLFYVALTRARDFVDVCVPLKYYHKKLATGDRHTYAQVTRFIPDSIRSSFELVSVKSTQAKPEVALSAAVDVRKKIAAMWS